MERQLKKCNYCLKEVQNLGAHIVNQHPRVMEQIEETPPPSPNLTQNPGVPQQNKAPGGDINSMIREKLDTMLNIKIIEMLSKHPEVSLQEISSAINPPQKTTLQEIKEYHDLVYGERERDLPETGNQWVDLATAAIPLIKEMLPAKKREMEAAENDKHRTDEERSLRVLKPISQKIARDTREPGSTSDKPGTPSETEQQNFGGPGTPN